MNSNELIKHPLMTPYLKVYETVRAQMGCELTQEEKDFVAEFTIRVMLKIGRASEVSELLKLMKED